MKPLKILVLIEKDGAAYGAYSPDVPGCFAGGQSREEVLSLFQEAVQAHINFLIETDRPLPLALKAAYMRHVWIMRWNAILNWFRARLHRKEEIAYTQVMLAMA
jgi:predicted RNase H-like HicB family nuclease